METLKDFQLDSETETRIQAFAEELQCFNAAGPLDPIAIKKLQEFFRVQHIFHSTGIEGNRFIYSGNRDGANRGHRTRRQAAWGPAGG